MWERAQQVWGGAVNLSLPLETTPAEEDSIAYIELDTRTTRINLVRLHQEGLSEHIETVLAHEVGHHLRYPHTLFECRRQQLFLREELALSLSSYGEVARAESVRAGKYDYVLNVFLDFLINTDLVALCEDETRQNSFVALYRTLVTKPYKSSPLTALYMAMYEIAFCVPDGTLLNEAMQNDLSAVSEHWRQQAVRLVNQLEAHQGQVFMQLASFILVITPYLMLDDDKQGQTASLEQNSKMGGELSDEEVSRLLNEASDVRDARRHLRSEQSAGDVRQDAKRGQSVQASEPSSVQERKGRPPAGFPSGQSAVLQKMVPPSRLALAWYRKTAARADLRLPPSLSLGEPFVPGPMQIWEMGDDLHSLDFTQSLTRGGVLVPGQTTLRRELLSDDPEAGAAESPWIELYIDSSMSMPNPVLEMNPQILAGFALLDAAQRAMGKVRVVQYASVGQVKVMPDFVSAAQPVETALLEYIGGGTMFPFEILGESVRRFHRRARVVRVVFSDADFFHNCAHPVQGVDAFAPFALAQRLSQRVVLLLVAGVQPKTSAEGVVSALRRLSVQVVLLADRQNLFAAARALADEVYK